MMNPFNRPLLAGIALFGFAAVAGAQNSVTNGQPDAVGVSPRTADKAMDKAVPRSDTATVVRTSPTAGDKVRNAGATVSDKAAAATDRAEHSADRATPVDDGTTATGHRRAARADRN